MILLSLWYVLSVLLLNQSEVNKIRNVFTNFMHKERDFEIDEKVMGGRLLKDWYHLQKDKADGAYRTSWKSWRHEDLG